MCDTVLYIIFFKHNLIHPSFTQATDKTFEVPTSGVGQGHGSQNGSNSPHWNPSHDSKQELCNDQA